MFAGKEDFKIEYEAKTLECFAKPVAECTRQERYEVLVRLIGAGVSRVRTQTSQRHSRGQQKKVYYFSMEFLLGRLLRNYLMNLGIEEPVREGLAEFGEDLDALCECERDPGLGNGGLGRLAACFLDSMAHLAVPGVGIGIRYRFGLFRQRIENGYQVEEPDAWLENGYPWEVRRPEDAVEVRFGGTLEQEQGPDGRLTFHTRDCTTVLAVPYDVPIVGFGGKTVNVLRLYSAEPVTEKLDLSAFNHGDYSAAMRDRNEIEAITCILYPNDSTEAGRALRLKQEYFFVAAGTGHILRIFKKKYGTDFSRLPELVAIHTNDTHPALCVAELMRLLLDEEGLEWDTAWSLTCRTLSYTNHTILPEALETWPIELMRKLLPRVYQIIEEIDRRYCAAFGRTGPNWQERLKNTAILWDGKVKMANLSVIGSHSVNGVAALHTGILKTSVLKDFYALTPEKFNNKTNGVSHRRFLAEANPGLAALITSAIGPDWMADAMELQRLLPFRDDPAFLAMLASKKREAKLRLCGYIEKTAGILVDPDSLFDIQVKRIHAYKRQLLNALKVLHLYNILRDNPNADVRPCTFVFSGKSAAGYAFAKESIKLICSVADLVNGDPQVSKTLRVVFLENFNVSMAELIYPAADISEQISTAGKEASGTGNMKFMMNGAITLGTLDGANVEIRGLVGAENIEIFGLTADEVLAYVQKGGYLAYDVCQADPRLRRLTGQLIDGTFAGSGRGFNGICDALLKSNDEYFVLKDFDSYLSAFRHLTSLAADTPVWGRMSLTNIAMSGAFSSDRTIAEYCADIWHTPCDVRIHEKN